MKKFVDLPEVVELGIAAVVAFFAAVVFVNVIELIPFLAFLAQFQSPIALALGLALVKWIENALPSQYPKISVLAIQLVLAVLAAFGVGVEVVAQGFLAFF